MRNAIFLFLLCVCAGVYALSTKSHNEIRRDPEYQKARLDGANTRIILTVRDDQSTPVSDVDVSVRMGMTFAEKSYDVLGKTDANGDFVMEGVTTGNEISISLVKPGFYDSHCQLRYADMRAPHEVKDGKWQPYPMEKTVTLRKIRNPVKLKFGSFSHKLFPATNAVLKLDLEMMDWCPPYGKGCHDDVHITSLWWNNPDVWTEFSSDLRIEFPNALDGYYIARADSFSSFRYSYGAEESHEFFKAYDFSFSRVPSKVIKWVKPDDDEYFLYRVRTKTNELGKVVHANYGRIAEKIGHLNGLSMTNWFNPNDMDANLEDVRECR